MSRSFFRALISLGILRVALCAPIMWTHDVGLGALSLRYAGSERNTNASFYSVAAGTEITATVPVQNYSSNPSVPYRVDITVNGRTVASENGSGLPSNGTKEHYLKWKADLAGRWQVLATLTYTKPLPGASRTACRECKTGSGRCNYPNSCSNGTGNEVCGCHAVADNPNNNVARANLEVQGGNNLPGATQPGGVPTTPSASEGVDLIVESANLSPSGVKTGVYEAHFTVTNIGSAPATGSFGVEVSMDSIRQNFRITGGLKPGESKSGMVEFLRNGYIRVVVDPRNEIKESNKSNNSK
ncbi:MAG: CARDB domain-containing protein [Vulcanimicrobiota bacterium]